MIPPDVIEALQNFVTTQQQIRDAVIQQNRISAIGILANNPILGVRLREWLTAIAYPDPVGEGSTADPKRATGE